MCRLFLVFCENFISLLPGTPKSARAPFLPKPGNKIRNHNRHDDKLPDPRPFLDGMGPAAHIADNRVDLPAVAGIHWGQGTSTSVASLSEKQRQRIYAHYFLGMSKADIARAEKSSVNSVKDSIRRGIRNLEKFLKESLR